MIKLSDKWSKIFISYPETGMDYQIANIILKDGRCYNQAVIIGGTITQIRNITSIPFQEEDIIDIIITHEKWDW
jgi:hypothetical protein